MLLHSENALMAWVVMDHCERGVSLLILSSSSQSNLLKPRRFFWDCQGLALQPAGLFDLRTCVHVSAVSYI